jgi:hypothetical protein
VPGLGLRFAGLAVPIRTLADVDRLGVEIDVLPPQPAQFGRPRTMKIAVTISSSIAPSRRSKCFKSSRSRFALTKQNLDDCPPPPSVGTDAAEIDLTAADVMALFDGAAFRRRTDDSRIYLSGLALSPSSALAGRRL